MAGEAHTPEHLFKTLADILSNVKLSEIAVSPYVLPEDTNDDPFRITATSASTKSKAILTKTTIRPFTLIEGDKLAIPQKPLYALFGYAVKVLSTLPRNTMQGMYLDDSKEEYRINHEDNQVTHAPHLQQLNDLTKCITIQNPEHTRVLNLRKKLLLLRVTTSLSVDTILHYIQAELDFIKLVLGIAANAKMGPLWHHRRWLYSIKDTLEEDYRGNTVSGNGFSNGCKLGKKLYRIDPVPLALGELQEELDLIEICVERYPRNYQAWSYRYWIIQGQMTPRSNQVERDSRIKYNERCELEMLSQEYQAMEKHLSTHIGDHTAAMHVLNVLHLAVSESPSFQNSELLEQASGFGLDFVKRYPYRETPWLLLRGLRDIQEVRRAQGESQRERDSHQDERKALSLVDNLRNAKAFARNRKRVAEQDIHGSREEQQDTIAFKYATRTMFYLSCKNEVSGHPFLGSDEARSLLEEFRFATLLAAAGLIGLA